MRRSIASLALIALAGCGPQKQGPAPSAPAAALRLACASPFTPQTTKAALVSAFGAANVTEATAPGPEGQDMKATMLFASDPRKRAAVLWGEEDAQARPADVAVEGAASDWVGPRGLKLGMTMGEVEKLNGRPFKISGFGWDYGGFVVSWEGGALERDAQGCGAAIRFEPADGAPIETVSGEGAFASDLPAVRAANARVIRLSIGYPERQG